MCIRNDPEYAYRYRPIWVFYSVNVRTTWNNDAPDPIRLEVMSWGISHGWCSATAHSLQSSVEEVRADFKAKATRSRSGQLTDDRQPDISRWYGHSSNLIAIVDRRDRFSSAAEAEAPTDGRSRVMWHFG